MDLKSLMVIAFLAIVVMASSLFAEASPSIIASLPSNASPSVNPEIPVISNIQCSVGPTWKDCDALVFGDTILGIRGQCTTQKGVDAVTFSLANIPDSSDYASGTAVLQSGYYTIGLSKQITDSGDFQLTVVCIDISQASTTSLVNFSIPLGALSSAHVSPVSGTIVQNAGGFTYTARVTCTGGECGTVVGTLDPTFGSENKSCGDSYCNYYPAMQDGYKMASKFRMGSNAGVLKNISAYLYVVAGTIYSAAIYADNNGIPGVKIAQGKNNYTNPITGGATQITFQFDGEPLSPNAYYWLAISALGSNVNFYQDNSESQQTASAPGLTTDSNDFGLGILHSNFAKNIFATYDEQASASSPSTQPSPSSVPSASTAPASPSPSTASVFPNATPSTSPTGKGAVPMNEGSPFYTTNQNPQSCSDMKAGDTCELSWNVIANGNNGAYEFFVVFAPQQTGVLGIESPHIWMILGSGQIPGSLALPSAPASSPSIAPTASTPPSVSNNSGNNNQNPQTSVAPSATIAASLTPSVQISLDIVKLRQDIDAGLLAIPIRDQFEVSDLVRQAEIAQKGGDNAQAFVLLKRAKDRLDAAYAKSKDGKIDFVWIAAAGIIILLLALAIYYIRRTHGRASRMFGGEKNELVSDEFIKRIQKQEEQEAESKQQATDAAKPKEEPKPSDKMEIIRI